MLIKEGWKEDVSHWIYIQNVGRPKNRVSEMVGNNTVYTWAELTINC